MTKSKGHGTKKVNLREKMAKLEHEQWAHWTKYMLDALKLDALNDPLIARWRKLIDTPYDKLTEEQKESDREWADKAIEIHRKHAWEAS